MIRYVFKEDEPIRIKAAAKADPQVIGEALAVVAEQQGGRLTPKMVVDAARSSNNPLHRHFEWDDATAADAYRMDQARNLIRIVRVDEPDADEPQPRAFLSVSDDSGIAYRSLDAVRKSEDFQQALLKAAERDLEAFERRYRQMADICEIVRTAREKVRRRRGATNESRAAA